MLDDNFVINSWSSSLAESVPLCSCPPQTFDTVSDIDEVDGGIFCSVCSSSISSFVFLNNGSICNYCFNEYWESLI